MNTQDDARFGEAMFKAGDDGKLVRLANLVRRLKAHQKTVRVDVIRTFLVPALTSDAPPELFVMRLGDLAETCDHTEWFCTSTGMPGLMQGRRQVFSRGIGHDPQPRKMAESLGKGTAGAVRWLLLYWADADSADEIMDDVLSTAAHLAVKESASASIGHPATTPDIPTARDLARLYVVSRKKGTPWSASEQAELLKIKEELETRCPTSAMVDETLGLIYGVAGRQTLAPQIEMARVEREASLARRGHFPS